MIVENNGPTQSGGPEDGSENVVSPREATMALIASRVEEERRDQTQENPDPVLTTESVVVVDDPSRYRVRVKIGEEEQERSVAELLADNSTARGRLRAQAQKEKELEARERNVVEKERQLQEQMSSLPSSSEDADDKQLEPVMEALLDGDTDLARQALRDVVNQGRQTATPLIDREQILNEAREALAGEQIWNEFVSKNPEFATSLDSNGQEVCSDQREYGDFIYDRDFRTAVATGEISYQEALNSVVKAVRKVYPASPVPVVLPATEGGGINREARLERKRAIENLAIAAGARAKADDPQPAASPSDVIKEMRIARGLPV